MNQSEGKAANLDEESKLLQNEREHLIEQLKYFWTEYQYRHDLCWRTVYKFTFAAVFLSAIPYLNHDLSRALGWFATIPPAVGALLALFTPFLLSNELDILARITAVYRFLQFQLVNLICKGKEKQLNEFNKFSKLDKETFSKMPRPHFPCYVRFSTVLVALLTIGNVVFVPLYWIPSLSSPGHSIELKTTGATNIELKITGTTNVELKNLINKGSNTFSISLPPEGAAWSLNISLRNATELSATVSVLLRNMADEALMLTKQYGYIEKLDRGESYRLYSGALRAIVEKSLYVPMTNRNRKKGLRFDVNVESDAALEMGGFLRISAAASDSL